MKLSFSLPSKPSSKPKASQKFNQDQDQNDSLTAHEYVTEFDPSKRLTQTKPNKSVIPPKENEWRPYKKMKNLDLPMMQSDVGTDLRFELESHDATLDSKISYGLNIRQSTKDGADEPDRGADERPSRSAPVEAVLLQKLRDDLQRLPEDRGFDEFVDMPVEGFGAALLAGYGWSEGRGIGKNAKEDVKVVQYERRTDKEGLGFVKETHTKKIDKKDADRAREKGGLFVGKDVRVIGGREAGLKGSIAELLGEDWVVLKLSRSDEEVKVRVDEVAELGSKEEEKCLMKLKELELEKKRVTKRSREEGKRRDNGSSHKREEQQRTESRVSWLTGHIRVRIISKDFEGGRLHLKKGEVVDVVGPTTCDISIDGSREVIQGVDQDLLETALPRRGGPVLVLFGKHKGVYGNLVEKDLDKETGVVRDADSHTLLNVQLDQIAEYVGDPSFIGY